MGRGRCNIALWSLEVDNPGYFQPILGLFCAVFDNLGLNPGYLPPIYRYIVINCWCPNWSYYAFNPAFLPHLFFFQILSIVTKTCWSYTLKKKYPMRESDVLALDICTKILSNLIIFILGLKLNLIPFLKKILISVVFAGP